MRPLCETRLFLNAQLLHLSCVIIAQLPLTLDNLVRNTTEWETFGQRHGPPGQPVQPLQYCSTSSCLSPLRPAAPLTLDMARRSDH